MSTEKLLSSNDAFASEISYSDKSKVNSNLNNSVLLEKRPDDTNDTIGKPENNSNITFN